MKDTANSPKVIGPGYRRDPPPKMVGPVCDGDCGCSDCKGAVTAKNATAVSPSVLSYVKSNSSVGIRRTGPSPLARDTLRGIGVDVRRHLEDLVSVRPRDGAVTWETHVYSAMAEQVLDAMLHRKGAPEFVEGKVASGKALWRVLPGPGSDYEQAHAAHHDALEWLLMGSLYAPRP